MLRVPKDTGRRVPPPDRANQPGPGGQQGQLPPILVATHIRFRTPNVAIVVTALAVVLLTFTGTFFTAAQISTVIRLTT